MKLFMDKTRIKNALETINDAICELNNGKTDAEDYYWWRAVLNIFGYDVDNGEMVFPHEGTACTTTLNSDAPELLKSQRKIVKCKDCRFARTSLAGISPSPYFNYYCNIIDKCVDSDWFCADGERKKVK